MIEATTGKKLRQPSDAEIEADRQRYWNEYNQKQAEARAQGQAVLAARAERATSASLQQAEADLATEQAELQQLLARQAEVERELLVCRESKRLIALRREAGDLAGLIPMQKVVVCEAELLICELPAPPADTEEITRLRAEITTIQDQRRALAQQVIDRQSQIAKIQNLTQDRRSALRFVEQRLDAAREELARVNYKAGGKKIARPTLQVRG